ncbi:MAG: AAA family ATPase [Victivallales bacterium]|nr:AAA family ATPase [Victivallales bacterium]
MKNLTTSIFDFEKLRSCGYQYIDKTDIIWKLIDPPGESYFLSRPRRFGKSLLISTLKAIFQGKRELFEGLAIYDKPYDWKVHPVIHLDFANCDIETPENLSKYLINLLENIASSFNLTLRGELLTNCFENLIYDVAKQGAPVILIDEYDKPILNNIDNPSIKEIRQVLKGFYSNIKKAEKCLRLTFITGVSKFSHVSLFSDLNNLTDITLDADYGGMLGFTEAEVRKYFADRIPDAAKANGVSEEELMTKILDWYDGYRFSEADIHVCNPVSLTMFFKKHFRFSNYWDSTGTPIFLLKLMEQQSYDHEAALNEWYSESIFSAYELDRQDITGMLWQTGYLTIKDVRRGEAGMRYRLGFPDKEVRDTFCTRLLELYGNLAQGTGAPMVDKFQDAILAGGVDRFMTLLQSVMANIDYGLHLKHEKYYQTIFFLVFFLIGTRIEAESCTNEGRIDAYIRTAKAIYIFEFKLNKTARKAVSQIIDRRYYEKFQGGDLPIHLIGVNFNSSKGRIDAWKELPLSGI